MLVQHLLSFSCLYKTSNKYELLRSHCGGQDTFVSHPKETTIPLTTRMSFDLLNFLIEDLKMLPLIKVSKGKITCC